MKFDSDEKIIKNSLNTINTPNCNIILQVKKKIEKHKHRVNFRKIIFVPLITCLCIVISVCVMGATIPSFNRLLSIVNSDIAQMLQPIEISSEDNGIKMEVVGVMNDDEMAVIYLTMQDLLSDRIDETLDIYDYSLTGAHMFNCEIVDFDEITKTATLCMQGNGGEELNGKKVSFQVESFLSDKLMFDKVETGINLLDVEKIKDLQTICLNTEDSMYAGNNDLYKKLQSQNIIKVLKNDQMHIDLPKIDFMYISNIGFINGNLHVQTKWVGNNIDDHGYLYFVDRLDNKVKIDSTDIRFSVDETGNTKWGNEYIEYIFDIGNKNFDKLKLMGDFVSHGNYVTGDWKTTFKMEPVNEEIQTNCNIKINALNINKVKVSSLGVTLIGTIKDEGFDEITVNANMIDGSIKKFDSVRRCNDNGEIKIKYIPFLPLDVSKVKSITIEGNTINFEN